MYFIDTRDLLFIVLSIGIVALVIFICMVLYQLVRVLRNVDKVSEDFAGISKDASHTSHLITQGVDALSNKLSKAGEMIAKFGPIVKESVEAWKKRKTKKK